MDVYFSYWKAPRNQPLTDHLRNMHKLSATLARKHYGKVTMLTDSAGAAELSDIGYDDIEVVLDDVDPSYARVWSLGKIHAYKNIAERGRPFLHLDYDVFLHKPLPGRLTEAAVFAQSPEEDDLFSLYEIPNFVRHCPKKMVPNSFNWPNRAWNMGIFGGCDCSFVADYADTVIALVSSSKNKHFWLHSENVCTDQRVKHFFYAIIAEQYYLEVVSQLKGVEVASLFPYYPSETEAKDFGYTHLMAAKFDPQVVERIAQRCELLAA